MGWAFFSAVVDLNVDVAVVVLGTAAAAGVVTAVVAGVQAGAGPQVGAGALAVGGAVSGAVGGLTSAGTTARVGGFAVTALCDVSVGAGCPGICAAAVALMPVAAPRFAASEVSSAITPLAVVGSLGY